MLLQAVRQAHRDAARSNANASSQIIKAMASMGVPFHQAVIGAIASLGGIHGPTAQARRVICKLSDAEIEIALDERKRIPGWGNSFHKNGIDPAWKAVADLVKVDYPVYWRRICEIAKLLGRRGFDLYPNAACFTAITADAIGIQPGAELSIVIEARMRVWTEQYSDNLAKQELAG